MKPSERLLIRLKDELGLNIPPGSIIRRTYAGHWLRSGGAFSWMVEGPDGRSIIPEIGSSFRVKDLLKAPALTIEDSWGDIDIWPAKATPKDDE